MKLELFDFQKDKIRELANTVSLVSANSSIEKPQAISFSAPTGAGKTIMMTTWFEGLFYGSEDMLAQSNSVILWISDMPELNEQTRLKIETKSDRIKSRQLITIDSNFDSEILEGGKIYFINTQKLGQDKLLTKPGDKRLYSIWETFSNTAKSVRNFYVVIDEAHRGMRQISDINQANTIIQKFLLGSDKDKICIMPLIIGISATPKRFEDLLTGKPHGLQKVYVSSYEVRKSGLLKDRILIHYPDSALNADMSLLAEATNRWQMLSKSWTKYCEKEHEEVVRPIFLIQVEDASGMNLTKTDLSTLISTIENTLGRKLIDKEIRHAFNDKQEIKINDHSIYKIEASRIEENPDVKIVLFKMSLSTGWDCPRAEVLMSFRKAEDHTYIAQLLGRMVRSPLARRINSDSVLNDVHLFLPRYNKDAVEEVIEDLKNIEDVPPSEAGTSKELVTLGFIKGGSEIKDVIKNLVTYRVNAVRKESSIKRLMGIARAFTFDEIEKEALSSITKAIINKMKSEIINIHNQPDFQNSKNNLLKVKVKTTILDNIDIKKESETFYGIDSTIADIEKMFNQAGQKLGNGLHIAYWKENSTADALDIKIDVIMLSENETAMCNLEAFATNKFDYLFENYKKQIAKLSEVRRSNYNKLRLAANNPQAIAWDLPESIDFKLTSKSKEYSKHLYVNENEKFRCELGTWEEGVIKEEIKDGSTISWLRNLPNKPWSFEIPYMESGGYKSMFPDLIIFKRNGNDLMVDIMEPHQNPSLNDNYKKAIGLAQFADNHWSLYDQIQLIRLKKGKDGKEHYYRLNINNEKIRKMILDITNNDQLDKIFNNNSKIK